MENKEEQSFEDLIKELEEIVKKLENRDISLDDAVANYTKGIEISKKCYEILTKNQELVALQMTENGLENFKE